MSIGTGRRGRRVSDYATEVIPADGYLSPEWHEARRSTVSASEIPVILGLTTWQSPFDLWWAKRTGEDSEGENRQMRRGRRLEAMVVEDFTDAHPEFVVTPCGLVANNERPWQTCTPDGLVFETESLGGPVDEREAVAVVEAKTDGDVGAWGEEGTDEIPVRVRAQVLWQLDTIGVNVGYVAVWLGVNYREYVVEYDETDVTLMRQAAQDFLASVREDRQPDIDGHQATTRRLKHLHPELVDDEVQVPLTVVRQYQLARRLKRAAEDRMRLAENRVRAAIGPASSGYVDLGDGRTKTFSHTISDIKERTQTVAAHTRNQINFPRKDV